MKFMRNDRPHIQKLKNRVDNLIDKGFFKVVKFDTDTEDYLLFMKLSSNYFSDKTIGKGEAAVIAHAKKHNGIVASNNTKDVMPYVEKYNLEVSLKLSRFINILLYNLEEFFYSLSFNELKNSLEMSDSLFLVMYIIYYFSTENDREITIFEDYHYDIELEEMNILKQIAVKKIIEITKSGNWEKVKNLNYVIYTYNLLIGDEYDDSFSFIISEYSSEENLIKLIKSLLLIENIDENSDLNWEILNKYLDTSYIWIIFKEHKENNSVFYRKNSLLIDQFLLNVFS